MLTHYLSLVFENAHGADFSLATLHYGRGGTDHLSIGGPNGRVTFQVESFHTWAIKVNRSPSNFREALVLAQSSLEEGDTYNLSMQQSASHGRWSICREAPDCPHDAGGFVDPEQTVTIEDEEDRNTEYVLKRG